eukprot:CAMPEP_0175410388 /NCGR_PEP_ID=MMETSP0095-20121207/41591_1 /TAXON_ID=311494 /ORGANISM="Alexandrium monilatum, Strain CCMP3105" /LENGTH=41 /DNA_ID= /DNA_START= /DNA_END= /DNA_ORIENTATION=
MELSAANPALTAAARAAAESSAPSRSTSTELRTAIGDEAMP